MLHFENIYSTFHVHVRACHIFRLQPLIECFDDDGTGKLRQYLIEGYILNCYGRLDQCQRSKSGAHIFSLLLGLPLILFSPSSLRQAQKVGGV